jgi:cytochrome c-type biogenesis protein CcmH
MKSLLLAATALLAAATIAAPALGAASTSLPDIEDEVMCPTCGVPLNHAFSPQAERQRDFIRAEIAQGKDKQQIKDALVAEFGPEVLAEPDPSERGFDIVAYVVPVLVVIFGGVAIWFALARWRRRERIDPEPVADVSSADSARLERDLSRYDS